MRLRPATSQPTSRLRCATTPCATRRYYPAFQRDGGAAPKISPARWSIWLRPRRTTSAEPCLLWTAAGWGGSSGVFREPSPNGLGTPEQCPRFLGFAGGLIQLRQRQHRLEIVRRQGERALIFGRGAR